MTKPDLSVLSVEPYGMKPRWDKARSRKCELSVLSVEPYGMKPFSDGRNDAARTAFSALGRAVWDETTWPRRSG